NFMWKSFSRILLRNRLVIIILLILATVFMGYHAKTVKMGYEMAQLLPRTDSTFIAFEKFKEKFGQDGSIMVLGIDDEKLFKYENFVEWQDLAVRLKAIEGVDEVLSISNIINLEKNTEERKFEAVPVF